MMPCGCVQDWCSLGVQFFKHCAFPGLVVKQLYPTTSQHPVAKQSSLLFEHDSLFGLAMICARSCKSSPAWNCTAGPRAEKCSPAQPPAQNKPTADAAPRTLRETEEG